MRLLWTFLALICLPGLAVAQDADDTKARYTKYEYRIPMRDGARLFTSVYVPKDASERRPILLERTPYSVRPYGVDAYPTSLGPSPAFEKAGYIIAYQDVRGCYMSEGDYVDIRPMKIDRGPRDFDEATDTYDTIDWLVKNVPNNNGRVGMWGISYPGFYAAAGLVDAHPALKAVSPQAPLVDYFLGDDVHHNGAFFLLQEFNFDATFALPRPEPTRRRNERFDHGTPDAYDFFLRMGPLPQANALHFRTKPRPFWDDVMSHANYDAFWKARALLNHVKDVKPAVLTVGGWFDAEDLYGPLNTFRRINDTSRDAANHLVMGPWSHGSWAHGEGDDFGPISFGSKTAEFYRDKIEFPFFEQHLNQKKSTDLPKVWAFETGRNEWRRHDQWPPREAVAGSIYLAENGRLSFDAPTADGFDEFVSDPAHPVPYTKTITISCPPTYMVEDQRFASRRPDVLVYASDVLTSDLTLAGPLRADLWVSTTGADADWVVKLIDVYPDDAPDPNPNPSNVHMAGYQQLVRGDVIRGRFRDSFETPSAFEPNTPTRVPFNVLDVYHTFRPGHRVMIQVQSSWFPLVDRNPQTFVDVYKAKESDFVKATHRVYHAPGKASRIEARVMP